LIHQLLNISDIVETKSYLCVPIGRQPERERERERDVTIHYSEVLTIGPLPANSSLEELPAIVVNSLGAFAFFQRRLSDLYKHNPVISMPIEMDFIWTCEFVRLLLRNASLVSHCRTSG
jgi:hypothetical protein